jgi:hypothetical protein
MRKARHCWWPGEFGFRGPNAVCFFRKSKARAPLNEGTGSVLPGMAFDPGVPPWPGVSCEQAENVIMSSVQRREAFIGRSGAFKERENIRKTSPKCKERRNISLVNVV